MDKVGTPSDQGKGNSQGKKARSASVPILKIRKIIKAVRRSTGDASEMPKAYEYAAGNIMPDSTMMDISRGNGDHDYVRSVGIQVCLPPLEDEGLAILAEVAGKCKKIL